MQTFILNIYLFSTVLSSSLCEANGSVNLYQGPIKGTYHSLYKYWSYLGVPYAEFKGRFKEPGEPPLWNGTYNANKKLPDCKQFSPQDNTVTGVEDCLNLNVFTPKAPHYSDANTLPVIFYVHGGAFWKGSNSYDVFNPKFLVKKGVVVVTIKYRLGAFGFLCLKNKKMPGNMGLKDMLAALIWVKNNIEFFGGNPNNVTIFGQSTGAASVDYFILTQIDKGLFDKGILHSGSSQSMQAFDSQPVLTASQAASRLGYNTTDTNELLDIFLNATADDVAKVSHKGTKNDALSQYIFKPCLEDPEISSTAILTSNPRKLIKSIDKLPKVDLIIGFNSKDGILWANNYDKDALKTLDKDFSRAVPNTFEYKEADYRAKLIEDIKEFYFNNTSIKYCDLIDYFSDIMVVSPLVTLMEAYLSNPRVSMYNYYFNYDSQRNVNKLQSRFNGQIEGASHTDELYYIFDPKKYIYTCPIADDKKMIDMMTSFWTNFAKNGNPSSYKGILWPRSENTLQFLKIDREIQVIDLPNADRINFWKRLNEKYLNLS